MTPFDGSPASPLPAHDRHTRRAIKVLTRLSAAGSRAGVAGFVATPGGSAGRMDRASSKHGPRMDEQLAEETHGLRRGSPTSARAEDSRDPEPPAEGDPRVSAVPHADRRSVSEPQLEMAPDDIEGRSRLGRYLPRSAFPADREGLLRAAREANAPDDILALLAELPPATKFPTVARVWAGLGHPLEDRF